MKKVEMETLVSCSNKLDAQGFTTQFKATENGLQSLKSNRMFSPEEIKIVNFYRFEGESNPSDSSILYAIETSTGEQGTLVDSYGSYSDTNVTKFMTHVEEISKQVKK